MFTDLINPDQLTPQARLLDCRAVLGDPQAGLRAYKAGHLPGALHLDLDKDLADPPGSRGRHPLPHPDRLAGILRQIGINNSDQIVVYDDAGGAYSARAWWLIRWLGHEAVAVLDGGLKSYPYDLQTETAAFAPGNFTRRPALTRKIDVADLEGNLGDFTLIDARAQARFDGLTEPIDAIAGHIPGALCRPFQDNLTKDGRFVAPQVLRERFADLGDNVVCYCGSGVTAAHNILAFRVAGLPEPILYPGSWSEWICDLNRPRAPDDPEPA
ncbi:MAG: sulfurtransferase [Proteobacteria bacterium]|nr:sulfurtransferase [Pseudomonadota bacterium]